MHNLLIPALALVVLPALYAADRLGLFERRAVRWVGGGALLLVVALSLPYQGVDFIYIKRINLLLAAVVCVVMVLRHNGSIASGRRYGATLVCLAALAAVSYINFFAFHGAGTFVHLTDVAHNYLGSKYSAELGYRDLYVAMLRAEAELYDNHFQAIEARDLETYDLVHIRTLLQRSDPVKAAFSPPRWRDFKQDVAYFREALGSQYGLILRDHGFNPTPVWTLISGALCRWVPAGSARGILLLTLVDPLLLGGLLVAVAWAFGRHAALLCLIHFCVIFGANFGWTGGSFLRFVWLFATVAGFCCLRRRRGFAAGALLALAAALRVFPALFVLPLFFKALLLGIRTRHVHRRHLRFFGAYLLAIAILVALTGLLPRGWHQWVDFGSNLSTHMRTQSPNLVGATEILSHQPRAPQKVTAEAFRELRDRRHRIHRAQLWWLFTPVVVLVCVLSRRSNDVGALLLGVPLVFSAVSLGSYYYVFLIFLVAYFHRVPGRIALIFGLEAITYCLGLFEDRQGWLHFYRSILVGYLLVALYALPTARAITTLSRRFGRESSRPPPADRDGSPGPA